MLIDKKEKIMIIGVNIDRLKECIDTIEDNNLQIPIEEISNKIKEEEERKAKLQEEYEVERDEIINTILVEHMDMPLGKLEQRELLDELKRKTGLPWHLSSFINNFNCIYRYENTPDSDWADLVIYSHEYFENTIKENIDKLEVGKDYTCTSLLRLFDMPDFSSSLIKHVKEIILSILDESVELKQMTQYKYKVIRFKTPNCI